MDEVGVGAAGQWCRDFILEWIDGRMLLDITSLEIFQGDVCQFNNSTSNREKRQGKN
jgi:hypothetical protein